MFVRNLSTGFVEGLPLEYTTRSWKDVSPEDTDLACNKCLAEQVVSRHSWEGRLEEPIRI